MRPNLNWTDLVEFDPYRLLFESRIIQKKIALAIYNSNGCRQIAIVNWLESNKGCEKERKRATHDSLVTFTKWKLRAKYSRYTLISYSDFQLDRKDLLKSAVFNKTITFTKMHNINQWNIQNHFQTSWYPSECNTLL